MQACLVLLSALAAVCSGVAHYREPLHPHPSKLHPAHKQFGHPYKPPHHPHAQLQFHPHKHQSHAFAHGPPPHKMPPHHQKPYYQRRPPLPPRNAIRPPTRPNIPKPTPPPFQPAGTWSHAPSHFQPPAVRETFLSSAQFNGVQVHDEDKGPIHTIPAPNLSPNDRPSQIHQDELETTHSHVRPDNRERESAYTGYQVSEEASSPQSSYFAPDPDPSLPTVGLPPTSDPHSQPSNGRAPPPDLQQQQQYAPDGGSANTLSPQDLYKLLHQQDGGQMTVDLYQQYLQAAAASQQPYQQVLLYPQQYQQQVSQFPQQNNFNPQFENFNYNEQTQEGAYGSDSFPSASISVGVKRTISKDTKVSGESINSIPGQSYTGGSKGEDSDEVVFSNQVEYEDEGSTEEYERETSSPNLIETGYYTSLPNKEAAETLATLAVAGTINNQMRKPTKDEQIEQRYQAENGKEVKTPIRIEVSPQESKEKEERIQQYRVQETNYNEQRNQQQKVQEIKENEERNQQYRTQEMKQNEERNQQYSTQERKVEAQSYQNHHMGGHKENKDRPNLPFTNHEMRVQQTIRTVPQDHQDTVETEYSEEEILDPSDKDVRTNIMLPNGMRMYQNMYYRNKNENKQTQEPVEEQSYEDSDNDYTQEEEKEIEKNVETKTTEKTKTFNAHQNRLPFGAKLRPKRV